EPIGRRERGRPDRRLGNVEGAPLQPSREGALSVDGVVREDEERRTPFSKSRQELIGAGNRVLLSHEDAVHVHEPRRDGTHTHLRLSARHRAAYAATWCGAVSDTVTRG